MEKSKIAAKEPVFVDLESGKTYAWCKCGNSSNQPWCNGAHKGTVFTPLIFKIDKSISELLCQCKQTKTPPYCDGTHMSL